MLCRFEELVAGDPRDTPESYGHHALPLPEFLRNMEVVGPPRGPFLDLGCGVGTKLALAHYLGWDDLVGVDRDPGLAEIAARLVPEAEIRTGDALDVDCSGFAVIYTYRLFRELDRQADLGREIAETADPGALVVYAGADLDRGEHLGESVWRIP